MLKTLHEILSSKFGFELTICLPAELLEGTLINYILKNLLIEIQRPVLDKLMSTVLQLKEI